VQVLWRTQSSTEGGCVFLTAQPELTPVLPGWSQCYWWCRWAGARGLLASGSVFQDPSAEELYFVLTVRFLAARRLCTRFCSSAGPPHPSAARLWEQIHAVERDYSLLFHLTKYAHMYCIFYKKEERGTRHAYIYILISNQSNNKWPFIIDEWDAVLWVKYLTCCIICLWVRHRQKRMCVCTLTFFHQFISTEFKNKNSFTLYRMWM